MNVKGLFHSSGVSKLYDEFFMLFLRFKITKKGGRKRSGENKKFYICVLSFIWSM
jgi:hypothetical protein